jgi:hypothetical protein
MAGWLERRRSGKESSVIKFNGIITVEAASKAVQQNGYALRYVLSLELFLKIAAEHGIEVSTPKNISEAS